jgi:intein/homing endonuclease
MVNEHLNKIFPDPELKQYFLEYCAMLLKGGNKSKTFLVLSGHGDNGKSINMELLKLVLGKYMRILPTTVLTGKKAQSSQATPELDGINGVRHVLVQEPEGKETMNIGTLKELTGNDEIYIRGLFKEGRNILPLFKLSMTCLTGDTLVSMSNGVSYRLENLQTNNFNVLSYDINKNGLINNTINNFYNQGIKQCVELTFSDGRKIKCTPDHKFLTVNNEWVEAQNINNNEIKFGIKYVDCSDVFTECSNYKFLDYNLNNLQDKLKASALCRIIGYSFKTKNYVFKDISFVDSFKQDIIYTGYKFFEINRRNKYYKLANPLKTKINNLIYYLPQFIFDDDCPKYLIREVLGGMFGIQGYAGINSIKLFYVCDKQYLNLVSNNFEKLKVLLKNKFNVDSCIQYYNSMDIKHKHIILKIKNDSISNFIDNIGIRYNNYKYYKLLGINIENNILPTFNLKLISIKNIGLQQVYDINVEHTHNFLANGAVVHNCNALPRLPFDDPATWNRIRVLFHESTFPKDASLVPAEENEQYIKNIFPRDDFFSEKLPKMKQPMM